MEITTKEFYADIPAGTEGQVTKTWEANGKKWYKLKFGETEDGTPIEQSFPEDVLYVPAEEQADINYGNDNVYKCLKCGYAGNGACKCEASEGPLPF